MARVTMIVDGEIPVTEWDKHFENECCVHVRIGVGWEEWNERMNMTVGAGMEDLDFDEYFEARENGEIPDNATMGYEFNEIEIIDSIPKFKEHIDSIIFKVGGMENEISFNISSMSKGEFNEFMEHLKVFWKMLEKASVWSA